MNTESFHHSDAGAALQRSPAICIAGMHRSGTSMVAQLLYRCGLFLGDERQLMNARADNLHGFWEHLEFVTINDEILNHLGASWDVPPQESENWRLSNFTHWHQKSSIVLQQFAGRSIWGWKDPRNSLTLPFWQQMIPDLKVVICLRNPLEVAMSLHERNEVSQTFGLRLWEQYQRRLLAAAPRERRVITHYDAYFTDPQRALRAVLSRIGLQVGNEELAALCATIQLGMRHHRFSAKDLVNVAAPEEITDLYFAMCEEAEWLDDDAAHTPVHLASAAPVATKTRPSDAPFAITSEAILPNIGDENPTAAAVPSRGLNWPAVAMEMLRREVESLRPEVARRQEQIEQLQRQLQQETAIQSSAPELGAAGLIDQHSESGNATDEVDRQEPTTEQELLDLRIFLHLAFNAKEHAERRCEKLAELWEKVRLTKEAQTQFLTAEDGVAAAMAEQTRQISELRETVAKQVVRLESMTAESVERQQRLDAAELKLPALSSERDEAIRHRQAAEGNAAELTQTIASESGARQLIADELAKMQQHAHALLQDREAARADAEQLRETVANTSASQEQTAAELATIQKHAHELWLDREAARTEAAALVQRFEATAALQEQTAAELAEMQKHAHELLQDRDAARAEAAELRATFASTTAAQEQTAHELALMQKHAHELWLDRDAARIEAAETNERLGANAAELATMQQHAGELAQDREAARRDAEELRRALAAADAAQQQTAGELALMQRHAHELAQDRNAVKSEAAELSSALTESRTAQQQSAATLATMQQHADALRQERDGAVAEVGSLRAVADKLAELPARLRESEELRTRLQADLSSTRAHAEAKQRMVEELRTTLAEREIEASEMRQEVAALRATSAEQEERLQTVLEEKELASAAVGELREELTKRTREIHGIEREFALFREAAAASSGELRGRLDALERENAHARAEAAELLTHLRSSSEQRDRLQAQFAALAVNLQIAERAAGDLRASFAEQKLANLQTDQEVAGLREALRATTATQEQTAAEFATMQEHAHALAVERDAAAADATAVRAALEENNSLRDQMHREMAELKQAVKETAEHAAKYVEMRQEFVGQGTELGQLRRQAELSRRREAAMREKLFESRDRLGSIEVELRGKSDALQVAAAPAAPKAEDASVAEPVPELDPAVAKARAYEATIHRIREIVAAKVPHGAKVLVANKGDFHLLHLGLANLAAPFPQDERGVYAGHHPPDSATAIAQLEALQKQGVEFFLIPQTAFWWFEHYREFKQYLDSRYPAVSSGNDACVIFDLRAKEMQSPPPSSDGRRPLAAVTIISRNYLAQARCLAQTFLQQEPHGRFYLLVIDRLPEGVDAGPGIRVIDPDEIDVPDFYGMCFKYDIIEFNTAVKPYCLSLLMETYGEEEIIYLDPDIVVMRPMDELRDALSRGGIVLTPHLTKPLPDDGLSPSDQDVLISGAYNLGFIALRKTPDAEQFLKWWAERLEDGCRIDIARGLFTDQRWIDLVPGMYESTVILRDRTYNVAFWNLHERTIERRGDGFVVNGRPAAFFHISGFNPEQADIVSKHQSRVQVVAGTGLAELLRWYADMQLRNGYKDSCKWEYGYSRFSNGIWVNPWLRQLYLGLDAEQRAAFGDPFEVTGLGSFLDWATKPQPDFANLSLFVQSIYRIRYDLPVAFPDVKGQHREAFLEWARLQGPIEMKYEAELIRTDDGVPEFLTRRSDSAARVKRIAPLRGMRAHNRLAVHVPSAQPSGSGTNGSSGKRNGTAKAQKRMDPEAYDALIHRIRDVVRAAVPPTSTIMVVSRGDYRLVNLEGFTCWHFPQNEEGVYGGYHPSSGDVAIAHLEALRARGGRYLLFPSTAFWWLDFYPDLRAHVEINYRLVVRQEDTCIIYELSQPAALEVCAPATPAGEAVGESIRSFTAPAVNALATRWRRWFGPRAKS